MKLIKIERIENKHSYDISVAETNCFFANGILVHNSNAGVSYNATDGMWVQSRENIITPTPEINYIIEFEDGTIQTLKNSEKLNNKLGNELKTGDIISF